MGLESTTTIAGLDNTWPLVGDNVEKGDDHLRLIKTVLKNIFPGAGASGFSTPITATEAEINYLSGVTSAIQTQLNTLTTTTSSLQTQINAKAPLASPALTGTPTAPTAAPLTNSTRLATTAYADAAVAVVAGSVLAAASQAQMEAASSNAVAATPLNTKWHPGVAKAWVKCLPAGTIRSSYNVTSVTDGGTGRITVVIATDFFTSNYVTIATALHSTGATVRDVHVTSQTTGTCALACVNASAGLADPDEWFVAFFGDQ